VERPDLLLERVLQRRDDGVQPRELGYVGLPLLRFVEQVGRVDVEHVQQLRLHRALRRRRRRERRHEQKRPVQTRALLGERGLDLFKTLVGHGEHLRQEETVDQTDDRQIRRDGVVLVLVGLVAVAAVDQSINRRVEEEQH